jgi:hypothetical protein
MDGGDGSEWVVTYLFQHFVDRTPIQTIKLPTEKLLLRKRLTWILYLIKYLQEVEVYQQANRKLGIVGNPNLPRLEEFDETEYKQ